MPLPSWLPAFNKRVMNPITLPFAGHLPGFGIVVHRGRRSGRIYRSPVNVFRERGPLSPACEAVRGGDGYVFALTYGTGAAWVRNVLAAGGADLEIRGRVVHLEMPRVFIDPKRMAVPRIVRVLLGLAHVNAFLRMRAAAPAKVDAETL